MKTFCGCNSEWFVCSEGINRQKIVASTLEINKLEKEYIELLEPELYCDVCSYWKWYDADYENMMYDLREMNL